MSMGRRGMMVLESMGREDETEKFCIDFLQSRGGVVSMPSDWRPAPPEKPGWWWGEWTDSSEHNNEIECVMFVEFEDEGLQGLTPDVGGTVDVKAFLRWCPATFPTPPAQTGGG